MKKAYRIVLIAIMLIAAGIILYRLFFREEETRIQVQTEHPAAGELTTSVTATGSVRPVDTVEVGTQVSGLVEKIYVSYNSVVKKGQLVAELDKTNLNEAVSNARATYNAALNQQNYYRQNYERQKNMYDAGVISKADYEQALYQYRDAQSNVDKNKTLLVQAETSLSYANIYSPIDGVVINKYIQEGQTVAAAMTTPTLFTIAKDINQMQVEANVDEADIGEVKEGLRVTFTVDAFPEQVFSGRVKQVRLGATTTSNVVTYTVIIDADNPDKKLKPGLTATVTIYTSELKDVETITAQALNFVPDSALVSRYYQELKIGKEVPAVQKSPDGGKSVWIKNADGTLVQKDIKVGTNDGVKVQVTEGLQKTDAVVLRMEELSVKAAGAGQSSPFMPRRPSGGNKKSNAQ